MSAALVLLPPTTQSAPTQLQPAHTRQASAKVLPRIFATASLPVAAANAADPARRKGPHSLRLVQASIQASVERRPAPVLQMPSAPVRQMPVRVQPELAFYRKYTEAMLRRYLTLSMESGRVPSLIGQDLFRGNVSHCRVTGFDDSVIFVHDVGKCLAQLDPGARHLIRRIAIEGYTQGETAALEGINLRTVIRRYTEAVDRLTRLFLERRLLATQTGTTEIDTKED